MFYSHQLLARKAPLGQIWMAATMHAKMNRRKLDKLNIIQICEEILNPSVPMALRLSGILMGGVVIVYERKVKLLHDDVTRLLVEINEAWKIKAVADPTVLPKGKSHAKREAVTLPENVDTDLGDTERLLHFSDTTATVGFQQTAYFAMRLDSVDEPFTRDPPMEGDPCQQFHQANVDNITLFECLDSYQAPDLSRFERFDIEGDEETQLNFNSGGHTQIPTTLIPSPPRDEPQQADEIHHHHHPEFQANQQSDECKEANQQDQPEVRAVKRKARGPAKIVMDYDQTIIAGQIYQSWLQGASDIVSRRGRKRKRTDAMSSLKIAYLMELPPIVLSCGLIDKGNREIYYPADLLALWRRSTQPPHDSPSGRTSAPLPPEPSSLSPSDRVHYGDPMGFPSEDLNSRADSQSVGASIERQRKNINNDMAPENFMEEFRANLAKHGNATENIVEDLIRANLMNNGVGVAGANVMLTPRNSADDVRSIPSSGSGHGFFSNDSDVNIGRLNKKRPYSSSRHSASGLEPVAEENLWKHPDPNFKLYEQPEIGPSTDQEMLMETGPTPTQRPVINHPIDQITDSVRMQMKAHFDTPGNPTVESLNSLAFGMSKGAAARLFYQTCVLATRDFLRVEQSVPYGDILISMRR